MNILCKIYIDKKNNFMSSSEYLKDVFLKLDSKTFDLIINQFIKNLTEPDKLFKPNKQGIERFTIFYYSHLFLSPNNTYYNKKIVTLAPITVRKNYIYYLINSNKNNKESVINLLYKIINDDKNILLRNGYSQKELVRINIEEEYFNYCLQHNLVNLSSKSIQRSKSSSRK